MKSSSSFCVFFNFFMSVMQFLEYRSFTFLVRFIPTYLMVLGAIVNGMHCLNSLYVCSLLVYKKATDLCTLTLYPASLLNCCMSSSSLAVGLLGFPYKVSSYLRRKRG